MLTEQLNEVTLRMTALSCPIRLIWCKIDSENHLNLGPICRRVFTNGKATKIRFLIEFNKLKLEVAVQDMFLYDEQENYSMTGLPPEHNTPSVSMLVYPYPMHHK